MKEYNKRLHGTVIFPHYKEYMENNDNAEKNRKILFHFSWNSGLCEFDMEGKIIEGSKVSKHVMTLDEAFMLFDMRVSMIRYQ